MASLNMGSSYPYTLEEIESRIAPGCIGNYAYGYLNDGGQFVVKYVGRSDTDLRERIKHGLEDMKANPELKYQRFKFSYAETPEEAFRKECRNYHDFGEDRGSLNNNYHPDAPDGTNCSCPYCGK